MRLLRLAPLGLLALSGHVACGPGSAKEEDAAQVAARLDPALDPTHRVHKNGLTSNGLFQNGLFQNGLFQNGLFQNGLFQNGLFQNGLRSAFWKDSFWQESPAALEVLRQNPHTREFLRYTYECAMPPGESVVLDPGPAPEHANLELHGLIGLAPEWGAADGTCNESCQRWLTACLLARTNAYGVQVDISMRVPGGPEDDTPSYIKEALKVGDAERAEYDLFEGAFYGNLFEQAKRHGVDVMAPRMYACSGTDSNTPEVTKRFNASPGAGGPIDVVGACRKHDAYPRSACETFSGGDGGAAKECYANMNPDRPSEARYKEVITVYLKKPPADCGNSVCEEGEAGSGGACPSDCPAGWAKSFAGVLTQGSDSGAQDHRLTMGSWSRLSALGPDNSIVLAGVTSAAVDFGDHPLPPVVSGDAVGVIAKFGRDGAPRWSRRFDVEGRAAQVAVAVNPSPQDGRISVVLNERRGEYESAIRVVTFEQDGTLHWSKSFGESTSTSSVSATALAVGPRGDLFITATLAGTMAFGATTLAASPNSPREFVLNLSSDGNPVWASRFDGQGQPSLGARAIEVGPPSSPGVVVTLRHGGGGALWKLAPDGSTQWSKPGIYGGVAFGPDDGDIYATGALEGEYGFSRPALAKTGDLFVVRYDKESGDPTAVKAVGSLCSDPLIPCAYRWFTGRELAFTAAGELLVGVRGGRRSTIDLGGGPFRAYETEDLFVAAFATPGLEPTWAKHLPMPLDGTLRGMHLGVGADDQLDVVVSGTFSGSMLVNGALLVSQVPEQRSVGSTFLASFAVPQPVDTTPPIIIAETLPEPLKPETAEATSAEGARVFFVPPLSVDDGGAGVSVTCSPAPNSVFPLGVTEVACTAADPRGNETKQFFNVEVVDGGPVFAAPTPVVAEAAGADLTPVFFDPHAADLVDGDLTASCIPPSGSLFPLGSTQVTCKAKDTRGNEAEVSFPVHVRHGGPTCGNGTLEPGEQCDDGNTLNDDGCTTECTRTNRAPDCTGASASPGFILASTTQNFWPIAIEGVSDPDGDPVTITATGVEQDEPVSLLWCPGGTCADATLEPLTVRAERDTWAETGPQPDGRMYYIEFLATDSHGAQCAGVVEVCAQRWHDVMSCGDHGGALYNSLDPWASPLP